MKATAELQLVPIGEGVSVRQQITRVVESTRRRPWPGSVFRAHLSLPQPQRAGRSQRNNRLTLVRERLFRKMLLPESTTDTRGNPFSLEFFVTFVSFVVRNSGTLKCASRHRA